MRKFMIATLATGLAFVLGSGRAAAQDEVEIDDVEIEGDDVQIEGDEVQIEPDPNERGKTEINIYEAEPVVVEEPAEEGQPAHLMTEAGMQISAGGGVVDFTDPDANDFTDVGGTWDVRLLYGTRSMLGFEAGYVGSAQAIDALGLDGDATLLSNGLEGNARFNLLTGPVQPFAVAGVSWKRFDVLSDRNTSAIEDDDDVLYIPLGAGLAYRWRGLVVDGRFMFRPAVAGDDLIDEDQAPLHTWDATARVGWEF